MKWDWLKTAAAILVSLAAIFTELYTAVTRPLEREIEGLKTEIQSLRR